MNGFCIETIVPEAGLRAWHGVLRSTSFAVMTDAHALADQILEQARAEADFLLAGAQEKAQLAVQEAQQQTLEDAGRLLQTLEQVQHSFLESAQDVVVGLAQGLFERLVAETTPRARIEATLRQILREVPPRLADPLLRVHPDDMELLPKIEWEVKSDSTLAPGACRLEAGNGQWSAHFDAAVTALQKAFADATQEPVDESEDC